MVGAPMRGLLRDGAARAWLAVALVGAVVVALVLALQLIPRLGGGQDVLDDARPAFTDERVAGDRAGITIVSQIVDLADPIATDEGTAAEEVPKLVRLVAGETGLSQAQVLAALEREAPRTTALLRAIPLSDVTAELPALLGVLAGALGTSEQEVLATLQARFPRLAQSVDALPDVTQGWNAIPGIEPLTRFDGEPVRTVPQMRDYFSADLIPVLERQRANFQDLDSRGGVGFIPFLLLALGALVVFFGAVMAWSTRSGRFSRDEGVAMWSVVAGAGVLVIALVLAMQLYPRLDSGDELLDDAAPAFTDERVAGARAGVDMVSRIVDLADPIATREGGAAEEVPELVTLVSERSGLSARQVVAALRREAPHATALLQAIPLSEVSAEIPPLAGFLSTALDIDGAQLVATLESDLPGLGQAIASVRPVTFRWNDVPGTDELTRFDGADVTTVPEVRDYFSADVVPVLERQRDHFQKLEATWPPVNVFPPLLAVVGLLVALLGIVMALLSWRRGVNAAPRPAAAARAPGDPAPAPR